MKSAINFRRTISTLRTLCDRYLFDRLRKIVKGVDDDNRGIGIIYVPPGGDPLHDRIELHRVKGRLTSPAE